MTRFDVAVVGAGIAGASLAAEIAGHCSVLLLEAEDQPGYHATGRSAAFWSELYGGPLVQPLTTASGPFLAKPPIGFAEASFLSPRGALHVARARGAAILDRLCSDFAGSPVPLVRVRGSALQKKVPGLKEGWLDAVHEASCCDIDVAGLHAAYLRRARAGDARVLTNARVERARRIDGTWHIETARGAFQAAVLVNAAGAWADEVAEAAGEGPIGIRPHRRTIAQLRVDPAVPSNLPLVIDALGQFYFKPEAGGRIWLSPHDETPCVACDSAPEEIDIALAIERLGSVVDWRVERVEHAWAGLRSFAPDRLPVYGFAPGRRDFFWFAGQGGFGIQTAPAAAKIAAAMLLEIEPDPLVAHIDPAPYLAGRFTN